MDTFIVSDFTADGERRDLRVSRPHGVDVRMRVLGQDVYLFPGEAIALAGWLLVASKDDGR